MGSQTYTERDLLEHFGEVLIALEEVKAGMYSAKLSTDQPPTSPLGALYKGVNEMIEALEGEQRRTRAYQAELEEKLAMIEQQRSDIRKMSTPIIEIWDGVICLPIIGTMDAERSDEMAASLLPAVVEKKARCVLVDVTGIDIMDTNAIDTFIRMARSVRLLGSKCVLTGLNPRFARTIVDLGVELADIQTYRSLRAALADDLARRAEEEREDTDDEP